MTELYLAAKLLLACGGKEIRLPDGSRLKKSIKVIRDGNEWYVICKILSDECFGKVFLRKET
jgi:hypothetical protein